MSQKYKTVGISVPRGDLPLLDAAKQKAQMSRRSFSNYICGLIEADLAQSANELNDSSSTKVQEAVDRKVDAVNYKIRRQRKPAP